MKSRSRGRVGGAGEEARWSRASVRWGAEGRAPSPPAAATIVAALAALVVASSPLAARQGSEQATQASGASGCWVRGTRQAAARRASPLDSSVVALQGGVVKVCYGRPAMRGRKIMGGLVPLGQPWRLGANEATAVHVPFAATIAGVAVKPGWYSLYVVPGPTEWKVVVNGEAHRWGIPIDAAVRSHDLGAGTVKVERTDAPVERLTLSMRRSAAQTAELTVEWETTRVRIPVTAR